jgi:hypothetical protein
LARENGPGSVQVSGAGRLRLGDLPGQGGGVCIVHPLAICEQYVQYRWTGARSFEKMWAWLSTGTAELWELEMGISDPRGSERCEKRVALRSAGLWCRASSEPAPVSFPNTRTMSSDKRELGRREGTTQPPLHAIRTFDLKVHLSFIHVVQAQSSRQFP